MSMLQRGHSGDGYVLASTLCKYDLFVLIWAMARRMMRGSIFFRADNVWWRCAQYFLLLPLVVRCIETVDVCIWRMFVLCLL